MQVVECLVLGGAPSYLLSPTEAGNQRRLIQGASDNASVTPN